MRVIWKFLGSKKLAVYMLVVLVAVLFASTLFPNEFTFSPARWYELEQRSPVKFWLASHFSTPNLVKNPVFLMLSLFLFLSTLVCTVSRLRTWIRLRRTEFEKAKAFTFQREAAFDGDPDALEQRLSRALKKKRWEFTREDGVLAAQKGLSLGFWGSVVFHVGLLACFLAAPVTALSQFRGEMIITEDQPVPFREVVKDYAGEGGSGITVPDVPVEVYDLKGVYAEGRFKVDFGGRIRFGEWDVPFSVNNPVNFRGFQLSLIKFGYAPNVIITRDGGPVFDYFLNLEKPEQGDRFPVTRDGLNIFVLLFPDFVREGNTLSSRSQDPDNPVLLVRFFQGEKPLHQGLLLKPGEEKQFEGYSVRFPELKNWVKMIVVREWGVIIVAIGFLIGIPGLFVRFLSNERRIEFALEDAEAGGTRVILRGYSRYYPAFLEQEVNRMADTILTGETE